MTRWFLGWSAFVGVVWLLLAASLADDETCSFICFTFGDMLAILIVPASLAWALGLITIFLVRRLRSRRSSKG